MSLPDRPSPVKSRDRQLTRRGVLWLGLRCDVRCKFCYDEHVPTAQKGWLPLDDAVRALEKFRSFSATSSSTSWAASRPCTRRSWT